MRCVGATGAPLVQGSAVGSMLGKEGLDVALERGLLAGASGGEGNGCSEGKERDWCGEKGNFDDSLNVVPRFFRATFCRGFK